ncbi:O-antigen ligase family protein [Mesotoga sp. UBA5557]|jgi:O-antigen ligase|uniref:O-antigen ligase family protein n=1 Tax=Mesotoga sp. UBA5557 TaxID=1946857 RepID=UPI0025CBACBC|nr:O-antigen ligase family protein [Mesotoga sp. UBA5557]
MIGIRLPKVVFSIEGFSVFLLTLTVFVTAGTPGFNAFYFSLGFVILLGVISFVFHRKAFVKNKMVPVYLVISLFVAFSFLSLLWSPNTGKAMARFGHIFVSSLFGIVMMNLLNQHHFVESLRLGLILGIGYVLVMSVAELITNPYVYRVTGSAENSNLLGLLIISGFLILINPLMKPGVVTWICGLSALLFATIFTGSRKTLLIWPAILLYLYIVSQKKRRSIASKIVVLIAFALVFTVILLYGELIVDSIINITSVNRLVAALRGEEASVRIRSMLIVEGIELWKEHPILGAGPDQFMFLSSFQLYSHNNYIELLSTAGILGFMIYFSVILLILRRAALGSSKAIRNYVFLCVALILIFDFFVVTYYSKYHWLLLSVLAYSAYSSSEGSSKGGEYHETTISSVDEVD